MRRTLTFGYSTAYHVAGGKLQRRTVELPTRSTDARKVVRDVADVLLASHKVTKDKLVIRRIDPTFTDEGIPFVREDAHTQQNVPTPGDVDRLKKNELLDVAAEFGLEVDSSLNKPELAAAVKAGLANKFGEQE